MSNTNERDIQALVSMIDEPDPVIYSEISSKIISSGPAAMPFLENAYDLSSDETMRNRLGDLLQRIRYNNLSMQLTSWAANDQDDILNAWLDITRYFFPDFDDTVVYEQLKAIRKDIWLEINENLTALEQVKVFNHVFYETHGFKGNIDDYHNPDNSFINKVLDNRVGNPLSLGVIYMHTAQSVDLPIRGINLPEHFVLAYMGERFDTESMKIHYDQPLFYINAFSGGSIFSSNGINSFLNKLGMDPIPSFFEPCSNLEIITRMLNNLLVSYNSVGQQYKTDGLESLRDKLGKKV